MQTDFWHYFSYYSYCRNTCSRARTSLSLVIYKHDGKSVRKLPCTRYSPFPFLGVSTSSAGQTTTPRDLLLATFSTGIRSLWFLLMNCSFVIKPVLLGKTRQQNHSSSYSVQLYAARAASLRAISAPDSVRAVVP